MTVRAVINTSSDTPAVLAYNPESDSENAAPASVWTVTCFPAVSCLSKHGA